MPLSRPNKAYFAQRGAEGPDALQKRDQSFNRRSRVGGLRSLAAVKPDKDSNNRDMPLSRPNKVYIAQRGAEGPDALQNTIKASIMAMSFRSKWAAAPLHI